MRVSSCLACAPLLLACALPLWADEAPKEASAKEAPAKEAPAPKPAPDEVWLRNGDHLTGEIDSMVDGKLVIVVPWGEKVVVAWKDVVNLKTGSPVKLVFADETTLVGVVGKAQAGSAEVASARIAEKGHITLGEVIALDPPRVPPIKWSGFMRLGATLTDGNTRTRSASAGGELKARSEKLQMTLRGSWNYAEDAKLGEILERNARGEIKFDFFITDWFYAYTNAYFEGDKFRDLDLRSAFGAGLGILWFDTDTLKFSTEAGLTYVVDDRRRGVDEQALSARVAWDLLWVVVPERVAFFHNGEIYPSLERARDFFLNTSTGIRLTLFSGFFASAQIDFHYDSTPSHGFGRRDTAYIFSLGYEFG